MSQDPDGPAELDLPMPEIRLPEDFLSGAQDAWSLEFGRTRDVVGTDDRQEIEETKKYPWRCLCALEIRYADRSEAVGTGWMAGPRTVITAGHCVFSRRHGRMAAIRVTPGRRGGAAPFGSVMATGFDATRGWIEEGKAANDFGAVFLPQLENTPGPPLGVLALDDGALTGLAANIAGYPAGRRGTLWWHGRPLARPRDRFLVYDIDTTGGQSGAPIWCVHEERAQVVGIHTNGAGSSNFGVRVNEGIIRTIEIWVERGNAL